MANKLYTVQGGSPGAESEDLEVYVDLAVDSKQDFNAPLPRRTVDDFVMSSERFLSAFNLSVWDDAVSAVVERQSTGWDWIMLPDGGNGIYQRLSSDQLLISAFAPDLAESRAGAVFSYLSTDEDWGNFTRQTQAELSSAVYAASSAFASGMEAEACPWRYKVSKLVNVNAIKNSIRQIFAWIPGERIINPEFGSNLGKYLYEPITDENQERIVAEIRQCAMRWEPRVIVDRVVKATQTEDVENNTVKLDIYYRIKGLNDKQFMYQYEFSRSKYSYM